MATYSELFGLISNGALRDRVQFSVAVAAYLVMTDGSPPTNQAERLAWAALAVTNPGREMERMLPLVLAANEGATTANILAASDSAILANVMSAVDLFAANPPS